MIYVLKITDFTFSRYQTHYDASIQIQRGQDAVMSRALQTLKSLEEIKVQERQRNSSRVRSSVTSALHPGVPGMVLILGEGTVPAQNHIRKAFGVVSTRSIHLIPWNKNDDLSGLSEG